MFASSSPAASDDTVYSCSDASVHLKMSLVERGEACVHDSWSGQDQYNLLDWGDLAKGLWLANRRLSVCMAGQTNSPPCSCFKVSPRDPKSFSVCLEAAPLNFVFKQQQKCREVGRPQRTERVLSKPRDCRSQELWWQNDCETAATKAD